MACYHCGASVYACTTDPQGDYLYAADSSAFIYCFRLSGELLWKRPTGCGSALSLQFFQGCLYLVTQQGVMACLEANATVNAMLLPLDQTAPVAAAIAATAPPETPAVSQALETTSDVSQGVIVEYFRQGQKLRIRAISAGYHPDCRWRGIRRKTARTCRGL